MYHSYFGMKQRPFGTTPQIGSCFLAASQQEALATLQYAITQGRGIGLLVGPAGTGKTTVCQQLSASLDATFTMAMITNTNLPSIKSLYQAILYDLSLPYHGLDEQELRLTLTDFLLGKYAGGGRMVLIIDEAQNLSVPLLEELRMLGNLEGESDKLFQIVLSGHTRLLQVLRTAELETLDQRIGARATLAPFGDEESVAYMRHQLECCGVLPDQVFSYEAMTAVYEASAGNPRLINRLCDHALLLAFVSEARRVEADIVEQACHAIQIEPPDAAAGDRDGCENEAPGPAVVNPEHGISAAADERDVPGICAAYGVADAANECLQIIASDPAAPAPDARDGTRGYDPMLPRDEVFAQEEIIVDPYAMMDAARAAMDLAKFTPKLRPVAPETATQFGAERAEPADCPAIQSIPSVPADPIPSEDVSFVEPSDHTASHEVGAGLAPKANPPAESPVLVIENRSQRIAGSRGRVDTPQPLAETGGRAYRRLFSLARKN